MLWAVRSAEGTSALTNSIAQKPDIEKLAGAVLRLQQTDGLCWAKADYHVKYTEANSEVFAGLRDLASLERETFHDSQKASVYQQAAERVRNGLLSELYDSHSQLFWISKLETQSHSSIDLDQWYPDTQAQFWPTLFGVIGPADPRIHAVVSVTHIGTARSNRIGQRSLTG